MKNKNLFIGLVFVFILGFIFLVIKTVEKDPSGFNIICMGDSLTESEFGYYPRHLLGLLKRQGFKANVYSAAQTGNTSGEYLDFLRRSNLLKKIRPDLVILMLGTN
ncbi:MAG: SGNH/GDSL hydrolase family protein, partial [Candidatus Aminicenantes bacterium]|nr:SGNH/GDSL hydrolase family protein [Candidatus Aminicenantes bacterium]